MSINAAKDFLSDKSMGDFLFRPSSRGPNFLNLTWNFYKNIV